MLDWEREVDIELWGSASVLGTFQISSGGIGGQQSAEYLTVRRNCLGRSVYRIALSSDIVPAVGM